MLDELREEQIIKKVGGRFRLSTLIQKRLVALNAGSRALVETKQGEDQLHIVIREIMADKIYLDSDSSLRVADGEYGQAGPPPLDFAKL